MHALQERSKTVSAEVSWTKTVDVVVVGYGFAGANAAISAHDTGAQVLLIEKGKIVALGILVRLRL